MVFRELRDLQKKPTRNRSQNRRAVSIPSKRITDHGREEEPMPIMISPRTQSSATDVAARWISPFRPL
ncbi:MAG TPA: hypothetical protein VF469_05550 [Kofleriaceae bacterium]